jgi:murein DD-endopeptidase MepM/ murein hydrolase activator NlpD
MKSAVLPRVRCAALMAIAVSVAAAPAASAQPSATGGAAAELPRVTSVQCGAKKTAKCREGKRLRLHGKYLAQTRRVVFMGGAGREDDRQVRPRKRTARRVVVRIPSGAPSGRVRVLTAMSGSPAGPRVQVVPKPSTKAATPGGGAPTAFPIKGAYDYGTYVNTFGGGRNHQGQDVFAKCGTPLVAGLGGRVTIVKWQDAAGNYVVIKADDGTSQAYMHLQKPAPVSRGQRVEAGQPIGRVGDTGRATGCHLHFELWTAPGWYEGGKAIDPLPTLKRWARAEGR